jgi:hypothetical protein
MKITHTNNVYSMVLKEQEWYGGDGVHQDILRAQAQVDAQEHGCRYISIMVEPDAVLSISPVAGRHQVWRHTFPTTTEEELYEKLLSLAGRYVGPDKLTIKEARAVAMRVFG